MWFNLLVASLFAASVLSEELECASNICFNGGTCLVDEVTRRFSCRCRPGFAGSLCQDACALDCADGVCVKGALGKEQCQCTQGSYCLNGGRCIRGLSESLCECVGNFTGTHCERSASEFGQDPCHDRRCLNGGVCHATGNTAACDCSPGFHGEDCSVRNASFSCRASPCENGGTCYPVGDPQEDGFACACRPGFEGNLCEQATSEWDSSIEEIMHYSTTSTTSLSTTSSSAPDSTTSASATDSTTSSSATDSATSSSADTDSTRIESRPSDCDSCVHSEKCIESSSGSLCICRPGYQGARCDQKGEACDSVPCSLPLVCQALVAIGETRTVCKCPIGWSGPKCLQNTVVSFTENSLFIHQSPNVMIGSSSGPLPYIVSLTLRTTVPTVHIVTGENIFGQQLFNVGLSEGRLVVTIHDATYSKLIPYTINDGGWYTLSLEKTEKNVLITVSNEAGYQLLHRSLPRMAAFDVFATRVGKVGESEYFIGCIADFSIDGGSAASLAMSSRGTGIIQGCKHTVQCSRNPCLNGGSCLDLWTHASCLCQPPFLPPLCMNSLPPSTFGHGNRTSFAEIALPLDTSQALRFSTAIQAILRSNAPNGSVLFLGETGEELATFISVSMVAGHIVVRTRAGGKTVHELVSRKRVDDNQDHVIRVWRQRRQVKLEIDNVLDSEGTVPSRFDHPLFAERLQLSSPRNVTGDAFTVSENFKGTLQDVRINEKSVVLHQQPTFTVDQLGDVTNLENVLEGTISDDICALTEQCKRGTCHNTFNDFECHCPKGYFGRRCERKDHCSAAPCATEGECENVGDGYMCTSPVTLKPSSAVSFRMSQPAETNSVVKMTVRTHSDDGHILTVDSLEGSITLSLTNGQLVVTGGFPIPIRRTVADGQWHTIEINDNIVYVDSASYGLPQLARLPPRIHSVMLRFGSTGGPSFDGCLKDVTVGDLPRVSFYNDEDVGQPANATYWAVDKRVKVATSCLSSPQCGAASPCIRGECRDLWNAYSCECPLGFEGSLCEVNVDECSKTECGRGQCVDGIAGASCVCDSGFTGEACDVEIDFCSLIPCKNGGSCSIGNGSYSCECKAGWTGKSCDILDDSNCSDATCKNGGTCVSSPSVTCACKDGFFGPFCEERSDPCKHRPCVHGFCKPSPAGFECECEEGYSGKTCSALADLCTASSCSGRGRCSPIWNATLCACDQRWKGATCGAMVDECTSIPCENDGVCESTENGFRCHCRKYYLGDRCEVEGSCLQHPCERGECMQLSHDTHSCSCPKGYEGSKCEVLIDYCKKNPCLNGGSCESLVGEHRCHCIDGFTDTNCETDIDECSLGFCSNGAKCRDRVADYECVCDGTGFSGKNCTADIDECSVPSNCVNGRCTNTKGGYRCDCERGFIGSRCTVRDPCRPDAFNRTSHTCAHGECINSVVKVDSSGRETAMHECKCNRGYTGFQCATMVSERKMLGLSYILGPMAAVLTVLTILGCVLLAFVLRGKRALHGHYSPSCQERNGARMQMNSMVKLPPQERLI